MGKTILIFIAGGAILFVIHRLASVLSTNALGMLFGLAFGLAAGLPSALLAATQRQQRLTYTVIDPSTHQLVSRQLLLEITNHETE